MRRRWQIVPKLSNYVKLLGNIIGTTVFRLGDGSDKAAGPTLDETHVTRPKLLDISYAQIGRPATFQDLAAVIDRMYGTGEDFDNQDPAVQIVQVGENDWLVP